MRFAPSCLVSRFDFPWDRDKIVSRRDAAATARPATLRKSRPSSAQLGRIPRLAVAGVLLVFLVGCGGAAPEKTDAESALTAQQAAGRTVYLQYCAACHPAYSSSGDKGPGLKGVFRKQFLPSGLPANDRFVGQTIVRGRGMMPPMGDALSEQQLADLLAYLHTL
jgi:mono/diheme cytochrome c family protein